MSDDSGNFYAINLKVLPETEEQAIKVGEVLSRAAAGLMLDGMTCMVEYMWVESESEEEKS